MKKWTDAALEKISVIAHVKATPAMLHSTLGRHGARAIRAAVLSELAMKQWQLLTDNILKRRHRHLQQARVPQRHH
jgi:hydrogenase large subunit